MGISAFHLHACRRALLAMTLCCGLNVVHAAEALKIGGTGAALGTMRLLGAEFAKMRPGLTVEVLPYIGSTGAIKGVDSGAIGLGLSGRPAKPEEASLNVQLSRYALTPLVIATHPDVKSAGVTKAQLAAIYAGQLTRWDAGGPIRVIMRPAKETDNDVLRSFSKEVSAALDSALERKGLHMAATDQEATDAIEATPGSIGTSTLSLLISEKRKAKVMTLDGVTPSTKALADGSYPYHKSLYLVLPKTPSASAKTFADFIRSPRGQTILSANGHLPVKE